MTNPLEAVSNENGTPRVCERKCSTCLFNPSAMDNGMRAIVDDARERGSFVMCHETYPHSTFTPAPNTQPSMCRGYWDANKDTQYGLVILARAGLYVEVPVPPPDTDQRPYRLVSDAGNTFTVGRKS